MQRENCRPVRVACASPETATNRTAMLSTATFFFQFRIRLPLLDPRENARGTPPIEPAMYLEIEPCQESIFRPIPSGSAAGAAFSRQPRARTREKRTAAISALGAVMVVTMSGVFEVWRPR